MARKKLNKTEKKQAKALAEEMRTMEARAEAIQGELETIFEDFAEGDGTVREALEQSQSEMEHAEGYLGDAAVEIEELLKGLEG